SFISRSTDDLTLLFINFRARDLHVELRARKLRKTELTIESVRISGHQRESPQPLQIRMIHNLPHKQPCQTPPSMRFQNEYIGQISESCKVRNNPRKSDLMTFVINAEAERILDCFSDHVDRNSFSPV